MTTAIEPSADEIKRVANAVARVCASGAQWDEIALAAILAMDRRAEVVGEPIGYVDRLSNPGRISPTEQPELEMPVFASPPAPAVAVPDGWKLVPVEPTEGMTEAGDEAVGNGYFGGRVWSDMLAATPTPPAAEAPGQEPVYRFLKPGEIIQQGDECPDDDAHAWEPVMRQAIGWPVLPAHKTMRRLVSAPPTYADAEAKGFERGVEAAATLAARFTSPRSGVQLATMIRSLASPAPKGEGQ